MSARRTAHLLLAVVAALLPAGLVAPALAATETMGVVSRSMKELAEGLGETVAWWRERPAT